jgi:hypothetical protein
MSVSTDLRHSLQGRGAWSAGLRRDVFCVLLRSLARCYSLGIVGHGVVRPGRRRGLAALAAVLWVLAAAVLQCSLPDEPHRGGDHRHVGAAAAAAAGAGPDSHAHVEHAAAHPAHDFDVVSAAQRADPSARPLAVLLAAAFVLPIASRRVGVAPRAPPSRPARVRGGRAALNDFCVIRC